MRKFLTRIFKPLVSLFALFTLAACTTGLEDNRHNVPLSSFTKARLNQMGSSEGAPMIVRIFKHESELEVWKEVKKTGQYELFRKYEICAWSGELGPKFREGDRQSPEGFYDISPGLMNPKSNYYLAYNTGFPNKFDRSHGRTGSNLMVHGDCSSRGCYAMTDEQIAEIYALARESFKGGSKSFQTQIYPFRMTAENMAKFSDSKHVGFWNDLKVGYDHFEITKKRPTWDVCGGRYAFNRSGGCGATTLSASAQASYSSRNEKFAADFKVAMANKAQDAADAEAAKLRKIEAAKAQEERKVAINSTTKNVTSWFGNLFGGGSSNDGAGTDDPNAPTPPSRN